MAERVIGIIGGSGLYSIDGLVDTVWKTVESPFGHPSDQLLTGTLDGQKLDKDGAFKMVSSEERRPARWVRNLTSISVVKVTP